MLRAPEKGVTQLRKFVYMRNKLFLLFIIVIMYACSTNPYAGTNRQYKKQARQLAHSIRELPTVFSTTKSPEYPVGTVNFNLRKPNYVIIHHTAQNACEQTLKTFTLTRTQVSAHYVICKDGTVHHLLNDYLRAWHGGVARWGSLTDINSASIGIEMDNNGTEPFTDEQIGSLILLLAKLKKDYTIPAANFIGHADIAPTRKQDPSAKFPWKKLSEYGFGNWPDAVLDTVPSGFDGVNALRLIGYDTRDSLAAIRAFKRHFLPDDTQIGLTDSAKMVLNNLVKRLY